MATDMNNVRDKLDRIAGVQPSQHWLQDCWAELGMTGAANCKADAVLQQILHHDLRDVVREFPALQNDANHPSFLLRRALQDSMSAQHNYKSELPPSFRLLVQVEELLDVSQNAETRLSVGPASPNAPAPVGNQRARCLKLCLSDGYEPANNSNENSNNNEGMTFRQQNPSSVFMAMEVEPIPALSVNSKAGVKVVMRGPIQIRHGLLLWQPVYRPPDNTGANGNANNAAAVQQITVLGGCVAELVQIQATALQQAKLVAGVGVDPTVRALIWNPETGETQEGTLRIVEHGVVVLLSCCCCFVVRARLLYSHATVQSLPGVLAALFLVSHIRTHLFSRDCILLHRGRRGTGESRPGTWSTSSAAYAATTAGETTAASRTAQYGYECKPSEATSATVNTSH